MLELIVAALFLSMQAAGDEVCTLSAQGRRIERAGPDRLSAQCPAAPGLQEAADAALSSVDLNFRGAIGLDFEVAERIGFRREGDEWRPLIGQVIVRRAFQVPVISNYPANWMVCAAALEPGADGVARDPRVACLSDADEPRVHARMESALRDALADTRFLPAARRYCVDNQYAGQVDIHHPYTGELWTGGGPMPDPADLPELCSAVR